MTGAADATALLARLDELEGLAHSPGRWSCDTCKLTILCLAFSHVSGVVHNDQVQRCPNGHGLMRRETERERRMLAEAGCERMQAELACLREIIASARPAVDWAAEVVGSEPETGRLKRLAIAMRLAEPVRRT